MRKNSLTRRRSLAGLGSLAAPPLMADQPPSLIGEPPGRIAPLADLVNVLEFENMAARSLAPAVYESIAGGDRRFFDRITFRPRMMVPATQLDLSLELFGDKMFAPVIAGPVARLQQYHADGEAGMARGASEAKAWMVVSGESSQPLEKIVEASSTVLWYQVLLDADPSAIRARIDRAVQAGCKAICITTSAPHPAARRPASWDLIDQLRKGLNVPVLLKGIMTPQEAETAVKRHIDGIVVSNYGGLLTPGMAPPMETLPSIADAAGGKAPILIDGGFRRGSDIFKALAFGATAVLVARPVVWGLAAYGAAGARQVLEMLQTELARDMAQTGKPKLKEVDRSVIKLHQA
jgi:4-hydroxymandelate oxidase